MDGDIESLTNLNASKDAFLQVMSGYQPGGNGSSQIPQKSDKLTKAQDVVEQAKKLMGDNVKKMIDNQKDFTVSVLQIVSVRLCLTVTVTLLLRC